MMKKSRERIKLAIAFFQAVINLSLATFFNCQCRWCKTKDEDIRRNKEDE